MVRRSPCLPKREASGPKLTGILETSLYVDDLDRSARFYEDVLGLALLTRDGRFRAYAAGAHSVLLLFRRGATLETVVLPGGTIPPHDGHGPLHVAFAIAPEDLPGWERRFAETGTAVEGRTAWPRGGQSLYVRDPDGHLLEFATPGLWAIY